MGCDDRGNAAKVLKDIFCPKYQEGVARIADREYHRYQQEYLKVAAEIR